MVLRNAVVEEETKDDAELLTGCVLQSTETTDRSRCNLGSFMSVLSTIRSDSSSQVLTSEMYTDGSTVVTPIPRPATNREA